jgi:hypothetical protein
MSTKFNVKGGKKVKGRGTSGMGLRKHARSGVSHNHAISIARAREEAQRLEKEEELRKKRKGKLFNSVKEAFNNK